jgi:inorganic pyrophosphatase
MKFLFITRKFFSTKNPHTIKNFFPRSNQKEGFEYRVFLHKDPDGIHKASYWHDIPLFNPSDSTYNMVIEVPRGECAKMEMSKETHNPIKQDVKKNKITQESYLRFYKLTPNFNYGFLPRTWENNQVKYFEKYVGDNDPLDLVELSTSKRYHVGQTIKVYPVGSFCLIDQDECDWKILVVDSDEINLDESRNFLKKEENMNRIREIQNWFKIYKTYEGKKENVIYNDDMILNVDDTLKVIEEGHKYYMDLLNFKV